MSAVVMETTDTCGRYRDVMASLDTTHPHSVLNPTLYNRMVKQFGDVRIAKPGEAMFGGGMDFTGHYTRYTPLNAGEYYRICCPFCLHRGTVDTQHRLWINHRWGVGLDPDMPCYDPKEKFWWMAICYKSSCLDIPENRKALRTMLYGGVGRETHGEVVKILPGKIDGVLGIVDYPGRCQRIDTLPITHQASQYLLGRRFDLTRLGEVYDISWCHDSADFPAAAAKIVIPIYMGGKMVSWQARPPYDIDWKAAKRPKYYICPRTNKRLMLYGAQAAMQLPFCIVVEGVTDVWAIGPGAVALFGKTISMQQAAFISKQWPLAIIVLDADATGSAVKVQQTLEQSGVRVVTVAMPSGLDPASIDTDYFWDLVYGSCSAAGVTLFT